MTYTEAMNGKDGQFGPIYPNLGPSIAKSRRVNGPREHGAAVIRAILALQRQECGRALTPDGIPNCASRSRANDGAGILEAVANQIRAKLFADAERDRKRRTDEQIVEVYREAMAAK